MKRSRAVRSGGRSSAAGGWLLAAVAVVATGLSGSDVGDLAPDRPASAPSSPYGRGVTSLALIPAARPTEPTRLPSTEKPAGVAVETGTSPVRIVDATRTSDRPAPSSRPVVVTVARLAVEVDVVPVGVSSDGTMELPSTVTEAGWYRFGSTPTDPRGTTVIAAHVDTWKEGIGPFAALASIRKRDAVVVRDRSGRSVEFRVDSRRLIRRSTLPVEQLFSRDGSPRLVLITCGGTYRADTGYADNLVVIAEPIR